MTDMCRFRQRSSNSHSSSAQPSDRFLPHREWSIWEIDADWGEGAERSDDDCDAHCAEPARKGVGRLRFSSSFAPPRWSDRLRAGMFDRERTDDDQRRETWNGGGPQPRAAYCADLLPQGWNDGVGENRIERAGTREIGTAARPREADASPPSCRPASSAGHGHDASAPRAAGQRAGQGIAQHGPAASAGSDGGGARRSASAAAGPVGLERAAADDAYRLPPRRDGEFRYSALTRNVKAPSSPSNVVATMW